MEDKKLLIDLHEKPEIKTWILLAIQHVFGMFGATILVPILVNNGAGAEVLTIPVALITSGIGTLIYIVCTKAKSPVYLGSSFAFITPMIVAYGLAGKAGVFTGTMIVGIVYVTIAFVIRAIGKGWIDKLLPPIVIGPMIIIIGLGLASSAVGQMGLTEGSVSDWRSLVVIAVTFIVTVLVAVKAKSFLQVIPFLVGIVCGYAVSVVLGMVDFSNVASAPIIGMPKFVFPFVHYNLDFSSMFAIVPVALVTICEHIGDHTSLSNIIDRDLLKDPGLDRSLMGDGIATFVAAALGGPANTTYGENTSIVGISRVASVWVIGLAAIFAIILGFMTKFTEVVANIPSQVLGSMSILLYGFISSNGLKVLVKNNIDFGETRNVIIASAMLVLGLGGAVVSFGSGNLSITISGMSLAAIVGILLNLLLKEDGK